MDESCVTSKALNSLSSSCVYKLGSDTCKSVGEKAGRQSTYIFMTTLNKEHAVLYGDQEVGISIFVIKCWHLKPHHSSTSTLVLLLAVSLALISFCLYLWSATTTLIQSSQLYNYCPQPFLSLWPNQQPSPLCFCMVEDSSCYQGLFPLHECLLIVGTVGFSLYLFLALDLTLLVLHK